MALNYDPEPIWEVKREYREVIDAARRIVSITQVPPSNQLAEEIVLLARALVAYDDAVRATFTEDR